MGNRIKRTLTESALWFGANILCTVVALLVTYLFVQLTGAGLAALASFLAVAGAVSVTWGSWISLTWTENVVLRAAMKGVTLVPGCLLATGAGVGIYIGFGSYLAWFTLFLSAIGTLAVSVMLWHYVPRAEAERSTRRVSLGMVGYPLATSVASAMVGGIWLWFITDRIYTDWRALLSFATIMMTILAVELASTIFPAAFSAVCSQSSRLLE